jgi:hypothetical protein
LYWCDEKKNLLSYRGKKRNWKGHSWRIMFGFQRKTMLYHGVSHMALKGLIDMGDNNIGGGGNGESFSQLPTQSVRLLFPRFSAGRRRLLCVLSCVLAGGWASENV